MRRYKLAPLCAVLLLAVVAGGCSALRALKARDQLHKGVAAYSNGKFQTAIEHFKSAIQLDPKLINARLYLATSYAQQYVPGGDTPENLKTGQKEYQRKRMTVEPNNPEPYYWIGVIDWAQAFQADGKVRKDLNLMSPDKRGNLPPLPEKYRAQLEKENSQIVDEGIQALQKAVELKPNDLNSMAYLGLLYRQKADLQKSRADRAADLKEADNWQQKAMELRKATASTPASQGS
jgi:tetratricopeptide (TPR) repeat protein